MNLEWVIRSALTLWKGCNLRECCQWRPLSVLRVAVIGKILKTSPQCKCTPLKKKISCVGDFFLNQDLTVLLQNTSYWVTQCWRGETLKKIWLHLSRDVFYTFQQNYTTGDSLGAKGQLNRSQIKIPGKSFNQTLMLGASFRVYQIYMKTGAIALSMCPLLKFGYSKKAM